MTHIKVRILERDILKSLDEYAADGWEFVTWIEADWYPCTDGLSRHAVLRGPYPTK